ncbi:WhiB family transcriptional regulator [Rhodococcus sp. B10]|uniref:WhiB family transcriptional regulator n=1 Tax=Rhodococcus sp. B10 TaxID=2695876 RepID=UPI0016AD36D7|nr:WhiB family transcriptional regulator [Rhodococcus sp. B10]NIL77893.1 Transcriptional regulator WhiB [Rhodococcus sp. B10]
MLPFPSLLSTWRERLPAPDPEMAWQRFARCNGYDTDLFFPPEKEGAESREHREFLAKRVCGDCPVLMRCRAEAVLTQESHGIWGGLSESERRYVKKPYRFDIAASA